MRVLVITLWSAETQSMCDLTGTGIGYVEQVSEMEFGPAKERTGVRWSDVAEARLDEEQALFGLLGWRGRRDSGRHFSSVVYDFDREAAATVSDVLGYCGGDMCVELPFCPARTLCILGRQSRGVPELQLQEQPCLHIEKHND